MVTETEAEVKRLKEKIKPFVWEPKAGSYKGVVAFGRDNEQRSLPFIVGPGESVKEKVLKTISAATGDSVLELERNEVVSSIVRRQETIYEEWKERGQDKDIRLSKNIIDALNLLQQADVEFAGYILADSKQEIHVIEGERNSACPLKSGIPTIITHTHPGRTWNLKTKPSTKDLVHFFKCPTAVAEVIFGNKDNFIMVKPTKNNAYENVENEDFTRLFTAIAADTQRKVRIRGTAYNCAMQNHDDCDAEIEAVYDELYNVLDKEFGIKFDNLSKGQTVTLKARGG